VSGRIPLSVCVCVCVCVCVYLRAMSHVYTGLQKTQLDIKCDIEQLESGCPIYKTDACFAVIINKGPRK
jgi:hypothetical protein